MKLVLVNYNHTPEWLKDKDYLIYDRSDSKEYLKDFDQNRIIYTKNMGDVDYDKLGYLIDNYDSLPNVFLWGKTNIQKYVDDKSLQKGLEVTTFTPLLRPDHKTYSDQFGTVCYYQDGLYWERADSWYFNAGNPHHFYTWQDWAHNFHLPLTNYVPFAPGGNYILTKDAVHKYAKNYYQEMRDTMPHSFRPAEAQAAERSYYLMWK